MPHLNETLDIPLYMQLYQYIRDTIRDGHLASGERLPSIRELSGFLSISRAPVEEAYRQLQAEGYIYSRPRSGVFVAELDDLQSRSALPAAGKASSSARSTPHVEEDPPLAPLMYDFEYEGVDLASFPFEKWRRLFAECLWPENRSLFMYGDLQGDIGLREQIAVYLRRMRGVICEPSQIVVGAGTYHSLTFLCQLLQEDHRVIATERAMNDGVRAVFDAHAIRLEPIPLDQDGLCVSEIDPAIAKAVYVTPAHQFPYGMIMPYNRRSQLLAWASQHDALVIENDYDGEFRYGGRPIPALQSLDTDDRVILMGTYSKALLPAFRLSYLVLPRRLLARFHSRKHGFDQLASPLFQRTLERMMESGEFERHMRRMRRIYNDKYQAMLTAIQEFCGDRVKVIGAGSGLHLVVEICGKEESRLLTEVEYVRLAANAGIGVYSTLKYELAPPLERNPALLLGFGALSKSAIRDGIKLLGEVWFNK
ncbi:PLP-dependent aminotransferase family protein [Cohnella sp. GbtcB17]|uniref:MocR-like pyridoxine biosynthesis transcription factor PdxR n=1 Tax=Cohnella sp. GbtcB17 TaxID=2824762 RepID=UPI001C301146|nr:PLP-dependent aminotransferase family protein [Cohnella sp. GbtcB17]